MPDILKRLGAEVLVVDGALGTMLHRYDLPPGQCPEQLNVTAPEILREIHNNYRLAGADCVTTNSFGGTRAKLAEHGLGDRVEEFARASVRLAREGGVQHVLADIGPTGLVIEPLGSATFEEVFELFAEQAAALASESPDAIIIETMTDIAEARCAVLAARSACDLPVFASCTFGSSGRMDLSGTDPATAAVILEAAGASAVGMNCGLGPEQMLPLVREMAAATSLPIIVQPNAGLPRLVNGSTVFPGTAEEMGRHAALFVEAGASLVGSCCGSSPEFTGSIFDFAKELKVAKDRTGLSGVVLAGPRGHVRMGVGAPLAIIGERINPTGKPELADSLREGSMSVVRTFAEEQQRAGADVLDVNVGAAGVDATVALPRAVSALVASADLPLVLDNTDPAALEPALRIYPGRALVNSVNGSAASIAGILPVAARYGAAIVVLALDDDGIPETVDGRVAIVERVRAAAHDHGLSDKDLLVDTLTLTAATDPSACAVTLEAVQWVSDNLGLATVLGVSNVSHGLPGRPALNAAFLAMAASRGLSAAIVNPADFDVASSVRAANVLLGSDEQAREWVSWNLEPPAPSGAAKQSARSRSAPQMQSIAGGVDPDEVASGGMSAVAERLAAAMTRGDADGIAELVDAVIEHGLAAGDVIGTVLTPAIQRLGDAFGRGEVFLPQLMVAAEAMKAAVARVKSHLPAHAHSSAGTVVFATVKGDIHSIGKDICVSLLESHGFEVLDLGVDVETARIVEAAREADAVCLSALMTTTLPAMQQTVSALEVECPAVAVFAGGAVVTEDWARSIGAGYSDDAPGCVREVSAAIVGRQEA